MAAVSRNQSLPDTSRHSQSNSNTLSPAIYDQISSWMCSRLWGNTCESSSGSSSRQPYQSDPAACKGCREWRVPCDHTQPQCEHCYQQQILCFYVNPNQPKRKPQPQPFVPADVPRIREPTPRRKRNEMPTRLYTIVEH